MKTIGSCVVLFLLVGTAFSSNTGTGSHFLHPGTDPNWNGSSVQDDKVYKTDYPKDDNNLKGKLAWESHMDSHAPSSPFTCESHTPEYYKAKCTEITERCKDRKEEVRRLSAAKIKHLQDDYDYHKGKWSNAEDDVEDAEDDVAKQKKKVKKEKMGVEEAKKYHNEHKHCPEELGEAEDELAQLEAEENQSEEDIDAECKARKKVLELEKCVDKLNEAEEVLDEAHVDYKDEKGDLADDKAAAAAAAKVAEHHEDETEEAKDALDAAKKKGYSKYFNTIDAECESEIDDLKHQADDCVAAAEAKYKKHKKILDGKEDVHEDTLDAVDEQEEVVAKKKMDKKEAEAVFEKNEHCPDDLAKAQNDLEELESKPNQSEEDIDEECALKKKVLELEKCVDKFIEAKEVLGKETDEHSDEKSELSEHEKAADKAGKAVKKHKMTVEDYKEALDEAKAARAALDECEWGSSHSDAVKTSFTPVAVLTMLFMLERLFA